MPTVETAVAAFVRGNTAILARAAAIDEVAKAVPHDPDVVGVGARSEGLRRRGYREVVAMNCDRFGLRGGLDVEAATDLLRMLASSSPYLALRRYGWSDGRYADWILVRAGGRQHELGHGAGGKPSPAILRGAPAPVLGGGCHRGPLVPLPVDPALRRGARVEAGGPAGS